MKPLSLIAATLALSPLVVRADEVVDPVPTHVLGIEDATKGMKGQGPLVAKIDVEQDGKALGSFTCELFDKQAPKAVANFVALARGVRPFLDGKTKTWNKRPFYDGLTFHRVIPGFMIQGGDLLGNGLGNPGYRFDDEIVDTLSFDKPGVLAMANVSAGSGTNGSQFFITEKATDWLNGKHTIFGQCTPTELVGTITRLPAGPRGLPVTPVVMKKVTITRGVPAGKKPKK